MEHSFAVLFAIGFVAFLMGWQGRVIAWRLSRREKRALPNKPAATATPAKADSSDQLRTVLSATYSTKPLLSKRESRVFQSAEQSLRALGLDWRVMAQVSLGEVLCTPDREAYAAVNSKRADLMVVDAAGWPRAAIEYQGSGHHQGSAAARDAVKKEALRRAGVAYIEVSEGSTPAELHAALSRLPRATPRPSVAR